MCKTIVGACQPPLDLNRVEYICDEGFDLGKVLNAHEWFIPSKFFYLNDKEVNIFIFRSYRSPNYINSDIYNIFNVKPNNLNCETFSNSLNCT